MLKVEFKDRDETRLAIAKTGMSLRQFSNSIGISQPYLSLLLSGEKNPSPTIAGKIAMGLGVELEDIFLIKMTDISISKEN